MHRSALATLLRIVPALAALMLLPPIERAQAQAVPGTCPAGLGTATIISHDFSPLPGGGTVSYCELCGIGTVRLEIENPFSPGGSSDVGDFSNLVVTEDLGVSGLTYVPNSTDFDTDNGPGGPPPIVRRGVRFIFRAALIASLEVINAESKPDTFSDTERWRRKVTGPTSATALRLRGCPNQPANARAVPFGDSLGRRGTRSSMAARHPRRCIDGKQIGCPIGLARPAASTALRARA